MIARFIAALAATALLAAPLAAPAVAQDAEDEEEDVIIILGPGKRDKAMDAYLKGDYATAEVEFELNLKCAERVEMLEEFAIEQSYSDAVAAEAGGGQAPSGFGDDGGIKIYDTPQETAGFYGANPRNPDEIKERTCEEPAWQLYMIALSQIQLGKLAEAKANLYRVIALSRNPYFFDAHYRIALLELLDGNIDKAEKRQKTLIVLQGRCHRRGERCDFREEIDEDVAYLEVAIARAKEEQAAG